MNTRRKILFATAVILCAGMMPLNAAGRKKKSLTRSELLRDNARLEATIDSLMLRLSSTAPAVTKEEKEEDIKPVYQDTRRKQRSSGYNSEMTDSLLSRWYESEDADAADELLYNMDSTRFESNVPDAVYIKRLKNMNSFIQLPYNSIVRNYIILYSERMPDKIGRVLGLSKYYAPIFKEIFHKYNMPEELWVMAVIESSLNPTAVSRAGAKGMWQFMYNTALRYGLTINSFVDERLDPVAAADAAARYLKDSYDIFGDWVLAIASYNCGAGNVNKAIRRSGGKTTFWEIYPYLPRETRGYVPAFVGALYTMNYYKEHRISPDKVGMPSAVDTFQIHRMLHFKQIEEFTRISTAELRKLNPQYRHDIIPGGKSYVLNLPFRYSNAFIDAGNEIYEYKADEYFNPVAIKNINDGGDGQRIIHTVRKGETLGTIAQRHRVSVSQLKRWNNLRNDIIRVGQKLYIYKGGSAPVSVASTSSTKTTTSTVSAAPATIYKDAAGQNYVIYTVRRGDSLYAIAKRYPGVSAQNIMDYNGIGADINPGMKIKIPLKK